MDHLQRLAVGRHKSRAQRLVTPDHLAQACSSTLMLIAASKRTALDHVVDALGSDPVDRETKVVAGKRAGKVKDLLAIISLSSSLVETHSQCRLSLLTLQSLDGQRGARTLSGSAGHNSANAATVGCSKNCVTIALP